MDRPYLREQRGALRWWLLGAFLLWLIFAISSYFVVNKPVITGQAGESRATLYIGSQTPAALARTLLDLGATLWIMVAALGVGIPIWRRLAEDPDDQGSMLIFGMGLGLGALGLLTLGLGVAGFISRPVFVIVLLALTLVTAPNSARLVGSLRWEGPPTFIGLYLLVTLGMVVTLALLPPTSWDGLAYHLTGPQLYLEAGSITAGVDIPPLNYPSLLEMLFLMGMGVRGEIAAKLIHAAYMPLLAGAVYLLGARSLDLRNRWLPVVLLSGTPLVLVTAAWAYNDLALSFYALAALFVFLRWLSSRANRWLFLCGIFSGLMMGLKYTAAVPALFFGTMILWCSWRMEHGRLRALLTFSLPALILVAPWLVKNWLFTGNPVYPFLFHGRFWDAFRAARFGSLGTGIGFDILELLRLPYVTTLGYADATQEATIGPFYLIFLPLVLFYIVDDRRRYLPIAAKVILAYVAMSYGFWTLGVINSAHLWQARFLLPGLVVLCPVLAWIMEDLSRFNLPSFSLQRFMRLVIIFVMGLLFFSQLNVWLEGNPLPYLLGSETRDEYLLRRLGVHYQTMRAIGTELENPDVVTFLWEPRSYYCQAECQPDILLDRFEHLLFLHGSAEAIVSQWREDNVSHVLIFEAGLQFVLEHGDAPLSEEAVVTLQALRSRHLALVDQWHGAYTLYRIVE